jgi:hypothetical protein
MVFPADPSGRGWFTIPTAACSMPATTTPI